VSEARARIRQLLAAAPAGGTLDRFLPDPAAEAGDAPHQTLRRRSAWSSTLVASLELARHGEVHLAQDGVFTPIHLSGPSADPPA
jgi:chromatin segregation and condensation protein Rec8/ScpA/Scc1 (kleisin family)